MVKIRLQQTGAKNKRVYRIVVTDSKKTRGGKIIEKIGFVNPKSSPLILKINQERLNHWLNHGAQLSESLAKILKNEKTS